MTQENTTPQVGLQNPSVNQIAAARESALYELFGRVQFENAALRGQVGHLQGQVNQLQKQLADAIADAKAEAKQEVERKQK